MKRQIAVWNGRDWWLTQVRMPPNCLPFLSAFIEVKPVNDNQEGVQVRSVFSGRNLNSRGGVPDLPGNTRIAFKEDVINSLDRTAGEKKPLPSPPDDKEVVYCAFLPGTFLS